jgi:hypothetical protein
LVCSLAPLLACLLAGLLARWLPSLLACLLAGLLAALLPWHASLRELSREKKSPGKGEKIPRKNRVPQKHLLPATALFFGICSTAGLAPCTATSSIFHLENPLISSMTTFSWQMLGAWWGTKQRSFEHGKKYGKHIHGQS